MDAWDSADRYENYMGRWSQAVAIHFLDWLGLAEAFSWLDIGCGPGALSSAVVDRARPSSLAGLDTSTAYVAAAQRRFAGRNAIFVSGDALRLPFPDATFDAAVSGLNLNFLPDAATGISEMRRVVRRGRTVALYVWDYAKGMQFLRLFWDAAKLADPAAGGADEGKRFLVSSPDELRTLFENAPLTDVDVRAIDIPTPFPSFDAYWNSFLTGQGSAAGYIRSLTEQQLREFRPRLEDIAPVAADGSLELTARAWAIRGIVPPV